MGDVLTLAERFWRGEIKGPELIRATGATEEIAPGVLFAHAFANVTAIRTDAGLVLIDTGNFRARDKTFATVRGWQPAPLAAAASTPGRAGGWWDGVAAHLKPADEAALGREVAALAGGVERLVARARDLAATGNLPLAS